MKMLSATSVAALALGLALSGTVAYAADRPGRDNQDATTQEQTDNDNDSDENNKNDKKDRRGKPPGKVEGTPATVPATTQGTEQNDRNRRSDGNRRGQNDQTNDRGMTADQNGNVRNDDSRYDRKWNRNNRRNVDIKRWQRNYDAPRRYRADRYRAPRGYSYRRWSYGQRLPRDYYVRSFWLTQFILFGLDSPPDGYIWVRYGPDALLIDEDTGEIIQVRYNVFYS
jgi:Ni/Co efflux regulator RcnB